MPEDFVLTPLKQKPKPFLKPRKDRKEVVVAFNPIRFRSFAVERVVKGIFGRRN